jgi:hypothetical protein
MVLNAGDKEPRTSSNPELFTEINNLSRTYGRLRKAGDQQTDLIDIKYGEPDPSVFSPPIGYSIQPTFPI